MMKFLSVPFFCIVLCSFTLASEPQVWTINTREAVLRGDAASVSVDENGVITPAPAANEVYKTDQPYIWSTAADAAGNVFLGTGAEGRIFKVSPSGQGSLFCDLAELNVSSLALGPDGSLFAATSPDGKVYKIDATGKASVYFEPKEKYIWALAILANGDLAVATGDKGRLYRVKAANAAPDASLWFDSAETNVVSLAIDKSGALWAGTNPGGLLLRFEGAGKPFGVLDSPLNEVHKIVFGPDGSAYVLLLGEAVANKAAEPSATPTPKKADTAAKPSPIAPPPPKISRYDLSGARSAVYRIDPKGGSEIIWSSKDVSAFSIYAHQTGNGILIGTSDRGRIFNVRNDGLETLALQTEADQVSHIFAQGSNLFAATSNQGRLLKIGPGSVADAAYISPVLDTKSAAGWGSAWWSSTGSVQIETRSGNSGEPDETWSAWQAVSGTGPRGKVASPGAQYIQWRAKFSGSGASLREMNLSFLVKNIAPEVTSLQMLGPNVGLLPNAPIQLDPNILLSGLDPADFGIVIAPQAARRLYQRGARSFQWTAEDRNNDTLVYDVYVRDLAGGGFQLLKSDLDETFFALDGLSFADGKYVLKVVAKDSRSNPPDAFGTGEAISEPFVIDNTQPVVAAGAVNVASGKPVLSFTASDKGSYLVRAEYSVDGKEWRTVRPEDGITDSPDERYSFPVAFESKGEHTVTLRVFDSVGNAGTASSVVTVP